jgi:hypothetical protein
MHIYDHVISVVTGEDALPVRSVPARKVELVHTLEIARYCFVDHDGCLPSGRFLAPHSGALGFSLLAKEFEREGTGRRGRFGPGRMGDDRVHNGAVSSGPWVGIEHLLPQSVRNGVGDAAGVYEDPLMREVSQQAAPVSDADRRVEGDGRPDLVDVGFGDSVLPKNASSQIGALDLEASLTCCMLTQSQVVHHRGGEKQILVVVRVI